MATHPCDIGAVETVGVQKRKLNGATASWTGHLVAEDTFGTWIAAAAGTRVAWTDAASSFETEATLDILVLIPPSQWWTAAWWTNRDVTVDIALPARFDDGCWVFDDLELDLFLGATGSHGVVDLDEFFDEVQSGRITIEQSETCLRCASEVERMLKRREEPFGEVGWRRFSEATSLHLPLMDPPSTTRSP